jgi:hypothetical protein
MMLLVKKKNMIHRRDAEAQRFIFGYAFGIANIKKFFSASRRLCGEYFNLLEV